MIFGSIRAYKLFNYILRSLAMFAILALLLAGFTESLRTWIWIVLAGVTFLTNYLTGGQPLRDKRIFISEPKMLPRYTEKLKSMGYKQLADDEIYFVKRSKYLRIYIVHMEESDGRLLVEAPKKVAESLYSLEQLNVAGTNAVSKP